MEIQWGDFYFKADQTVALIIVATPIMTLLYTSKFYETIKTLKGWIEKRKQQKQSYQKRIDNASI